MDFENQDLPTEVEEVSVENTKTLQETAKEVFAEISSRNSQNTEEDQSDSDRGRDRDRKGRFVKKEEAQQTAPEYNEEDSTNEPQPQVNQTEVIKPSVPPELQRLGLRKEEAEAIASNPVALQAVIRRFEETQRGLEQYRQKSQFGEQMEQAILPYLHTIQKLGVQPVQAVQHLMAADDLLRNGTQQQKQSMLVQISRDYGIDLNFDPAKVQTVDPNIFALQQQLQRLQSTVLQQEKAVNEREQQALYSELEAFRSDPANIYFEAVRAEMAGLIQSGICSTLKEAYERAIYSNPEIRAIVLAKQQEEAALKRKAEANQKAQEARRLAAVNVPKKGTLPQAKRIGTMRETAAEVAANLGLL